MIYVLAAHGEDSDEIAEAFGDFDDPFLAQHGGLIPGVGLAEKVLDATCTLGGLFPRFGGGLGDDVDGACSALEVGFPSVIATLAVGKACFQPSIVHAAEVEEIESVSDMKVVSPDTMETRAPGYGTGKDGGFRIAVAEEGVAALAEKRAGRIDGGLVVEMLTDINAKGRKGCRNVLAAKILG